MKGGRKNLKRTAKEDGLVLQEGQSIMRVVSLRGSNLIEVMDAKRVKSLALFPAKFQRSFWIKSGNFVVVDESGREKALESGSKVACVVSRVLYREQVHEFEKSPEWPEIFRKVASDDSSDNPPGHVSQPDKLQSSDEEDGLPPLEANTNRVRPMELRSTESRDSSSDSDP